MAKQYSDTPLTVGLKSEFSLSWIFVDLEKYQIVDNDCNVIFSIMAAHFANLVAANISGKKFLKTRDKF